jgi:hypothetical protein
MGEDGVNGGVRSYRGGEKMIWKSWEYKGRVKEG